MSILGVPVLTFLTFLPLAGAAVICLVPRDRQVWIRRVAFGAAVLDFAASLRLLQGFAVGEAGFQFVERRPWVPSLGIHYFMGVDGISLWLVLLTTFLTAVAVLSSFAAVTEKVKAYYICLLLLETGMLGVFAALDLVLFYVFWEGMLIPMYFLIGVWGGPRRIYATIKFVLYTMAGGVLMLVAIIALYFLGGQTFDFLQLARQGFAPGAQRWLFAAFAVAFAIKVPMWPFHTWLPDAHVEAPTAGSVILAGILLKMGTYGFLRFALPLFPVATREFAPLVLALAVIGILYGALVSMVQPDLKKLVAYSSVSHLGFVMLGMFAFTVQGVQGSLLQMINHGLSTGALFLLVGMVYERRHTRMIADFGGLWAVMPAFAGLFLVVTLSSIGLPGLNGFVGEFLILSGAFGPRPWFAALATLGIILGAVYMLWMFQRVMFGTVTHEENRRLPDLTPREYAVLLPVIAAIIWIGLYPDPILRRMDASVRVVVQQVQAGGAAHGPVSGVSFVVSGRDGSGDAIRSPAQTPPETTNDKRQTTNPVAR
jgi:NADH-quinone oxidoreductase subunit M